MAKAPNDDPASYPALGRMIHFLVRPGHDRWLVTALIGLCVALVAGSFVYSVHGHFPFEKIPAIYAVMGFAMFTTVIFVAKGLRVLIKRPEDYYGDKAIDCEDYPEAETEKVRRDV